MPDTAPRQPGPAGAALTPAILASLGVLAALGPLAIDLYLSAFPTMVADLGTDPTGVQLSLTGYLLGVATGQLVFGPLSDRFGRRGPLLIGLSICVGASAVAAFAPSLEFLIAARVVQGIGVASGAVIGRAIISDLSSGDAAARAFSVMMIVGNVAPIIAPSLGSMIGAAVGWRGVLATVGVMSAALIISVVLLLRESHPRDRRPRRSHDRGSHHRALSELRSRGLLGNTLAMAFSTGIMMAYIAASPFVYQQMLGFSPIGFGLIFGANATAMLLVNWWSTRLIGRYRVRSILGVGVAVMASACVAVLLLLLLDAPAGWLIAPLSVAVGAVGAVAPKATAEAIAHVPRIAGTGSAVLGALQFVVGAAVTPLASAEGATSARPLALTMTTCAVLMSAAFLWARPVRSAGPPSAAPSSNEPIS